ncbi:hypothetical protein QWZ03_01445 [Chitinimonas viridis]|uniref:CdiI immunity protein domain-containing protein n=1 Tax=Chitinimonas viridis TaxID=664880 RepID=A0ABT8AZM5_9NEIS|nr:hypothetical protein [Chitinimonas viridis]MDN3575437.1 hypothetical protein [Chitinimonas viridis]
MKTLDAELAYMAMVSFLEKYYELTHADEIGDLLSSMTIWGDGKPADAAIWSDWLEAIEQVLAQHPEKS